MNNYELKSLAFQARLLFLAALLAVISFAFVAQHSDNASYSDDTQRVRINEMQQPSGDSDPNLQPNSLNAFFTAIVLAYVSAYVSIIHFGRQVVIQLTFLYRIRPRSPPQF